MSSGIRIKPCKARASPTQYTLSNHHLRLWYCTCFTPLSSNQGGTRRDLPALTLQTNHRASMRGELSQVSSITEREGDKDITSNQPVNACVANIDIHRTDLTATYSCNFLDLPSSLLRYMRPWSIGLTFSSTPLRLKDCVNVKWPRYCLLAP